MKKEKRKRKELPKCGKKKKKNLKSSYGGVSEE